MCCCSPPPLDWATGPHMQQQPPPLGLLQPLQLSTLTTRPEHHTEAWAWASALVCSTSEERQCCLLSILPLICEKLTFSAWSPLSFLSLSSLPPGLLLCTTSCFLATSLSLKRVPKKINLICANEILILGTSCRGRRLTALGGKRSTFSYLPPRPTFHSRLSHTLNTSLHYKGKKPTL